jgi:hypothetical protein
MNERRLEQRKQTSLPLPIQLLTSSTNEEEDWVPPPNGIPNILEYLPKLKLNPHLLQTDLYIFSRKIQVVESKYSLVFSISTQ